MLETATTKHEEAMSKLDKIKREAEEHRNDYS